MIHNLILPTGYFDAVLVVTVEAGSIVTSTLGSTTLTKQSDGKAVFNIQKPGLWTIRATKDDQVIENTINIIESKKYILALSYFDKHTVLLLHGDSLKDSSMYNVPCSNNGVVVTSEKSKFGGTSLYLNQNSTAIWSPLINDGDYTVDFWAYNISDANMGAPAPFTLNAGNSGDPQGIHFLWGHTFYYVGQTASYRVNKPESIPYNQWIHFAFSKKDTTFYFFINGKLKDIIQNVPNYTYKFLQLGNLKPFAPDAWFKGYIDEFRVSNVSRWTSDFIPSTKPYKS